MSLPEKDPRGLPARTPEVAEPWPPSVQGVFGEAGPEDSEVVRLPL